VTIYLITTFHRPQFGRDRIVAALPAAAAVATPRVFNVSFVYCPQILPGRIRALGEGAGKVAKDL